MFAVERHNSAGRLEERRLRAMRLSSSGGMSSVKVKSVEHARLAALGTTLFKWSDWQAPIVSQLFPCWLHHAATGGCH